MGYKMNGFSGFGNSPAKQKTKIDPDAPGTPGKPGYEPEVKSMDYLTKTPNPTTKAIRSTSKDHLEDWSDDEFENKGDFNISNLHKDTKISLDKKKKKLAANKASNKKRSDAERAHEAREDAEGK